MQTTWKICAGGTPRGTTNGHSGWFANYIQKACGCRRVYAFCRKYLLPPNREKR